VLLEQARQAGRNPFRLSCAKRQIAESIGTAPETLSRALRKFQEDGLIAVDGAEVTILDASALADRASGPI
jgi:CRP/FNR family transcriptional regulator